MVATPDDVAKIAQYGWLQPGESLHRVFERGHGHLVSTVAGRTAVPHEPPPGAFPKCAQDAPAGSRLPSELVADGGYLDDEWAHDMGVLGWATADAPGRTALACADALAAGNGLAWLAATDRRIAVVMPARSVDLPPDRLPPPAPLRGLETGLVTYWEAPSGVVAGVYEEVLGRHLIGYPFTRIAFTDGSWLLLRRS